ncbi:hypothetical protein M0R45_037058 [Rubus argutus]|uniref:Late embryogenesis abundant protein LEA-2 subgroup domain-containing protein n=1 Tax=Rubus argutus TaxID=59490 RepID=A0AAW1VZL1_RUBAR
MNRETKIIVFGTCFGIIFFIAGTLLVLFLCGTSNLEVKITKASLTQFNLNNEKDTLNYNLALDVAIGNTKHVHYRSIEVVAKYENESFAFVNSPPYTQRDKKTTIMNLIFQGPHEVWFSESDLSHFKLETDAGVYSIDVVVTLRIRGHIHVYKREWICRLKLPLSSNQESPSPNFEATKCFV